MEAAISAPAHGAGAGFSDERKVRLGFLFYVLTDVTFVIFLLVSYVWLRAYNTPGTDPTQGGWFPFKGMALPDQTTTNMLVVLIVASAVFFFIAQRGIAMGNQLLLRLGLVVALALVVVTLVMQARFMGAQQFAAKDGSFASTWLLLSGYHVYHLAIGVFLGLALTIRAFRGKYTRERHLGLVTVGYFWYWMALMPILVWLMMTLLPPKI
ncbi:MAG: hypothetical protein OJF49_002918 [Ktedonobacterales bacterium]|jgi:heme/copper-type cytochrome/quinol oxidase subunit 3|nr:MAG: hypothetical protein OJF49_002918 [Ktedonobacterales bacterium]